MTTQAHFPDSMRAAVIGASGGIGRAFVEALAARPNVAEVVAFTRTPDEFDIPGARAAFIDIGEESSVAEAASLATAEGPLDLVIVATGMLHDDGLQPEKSMRNLAADDMARVLAVNTIAPAILAKHFLPAFRRGSKSVFAALSARVGSTTDNRLGGWASYRASKAALNMILKTLSIEHARRFPDSIVVALHPGTVDTPLSQPFQKRVPDKQLFSASRSAGHLLEVIDGLTPNDTGGFFAWDGTRIEY